MEAIIAAFTTIAANWLKNRVEPRFGAMGVQALVFVIALVVSAVYLQVKDTPTFALLMEQAVRTTMFAVGLYEIVWKRIA